MPKQCSLAMTGQHMTGSAQLIGMLNGLGHGSSNSLVLEHYTALANLQIKMEDIYNPESIIAEVKKNTEERVHVNCMICYVPTYANVHHATTGHLVTPS